MYMKIPEGKLDYIISKFSIYRLLQKNTYIRVQSLVMKKATFSGFCLVLLTACSSNSFAQRFQLNGTGPATTLSPGGMYWANNLASATAQSFTKDFDQYSMKPILYHGNLWSYGTEYTPKGGRLFFEDWVRGTVVKNSGETIYGDRYYFNFDKITNDLLVTIDKEDIVEIYKDSIQSFQFVQNGEVYTFKKIPQIQHWRFVQVLMENEKYSLYKSISTKLVYANFNTNGLTETGKNYDEYVDKNLYFIVYKKDIRPTQLHFSAIKKNLSENSSLVKDYYADHLMDDVDEHYLVNLVGYLNRH